MSRRTSPREPPLGKLIAKTAGITLACFLAFILILFGVFTVFVPSVMLSITDACGMERLSTQYAVSVYSRSGEIEDLADVVERGYTSESWQIVSDYGDRLMARADYEEFCAAQDADNTDGAIRGRYAQFICGAVAVAEYRTGRKTASIETAFSLNRRSFEDNNAVVTLAMTAVDRGDKAFAAEILAELRELTESVNFDLEQDVRNLETLIGILEAFCTESAA